MLNNLRKYLVQEDFLNEYYSFLDHENYLDTISTYDSAL